MNLNLEQIQIQSFTSDALEYARSTRGATLSLVDGHRLAELMINYGLGVATETVAEIKRVDMDNFDEN